ncbi:hypothetical protein QFZ68_002093 [Streptomyces sp. V1I6]|nr:hypothetical protein [Streptomyces sp. V1I6]
MAERTCTVEGCGRGHYGHGYCNAHYKRWRKSGQAGPTAIAPQAATHAVAPVPCSVVDCTDKARGHGLCSKHYQRARTHGDINDLHHQSGDAHHGWKGDAVSYVGAHARIRRTRGKASALDCQHCTDRAEHWAYDHQDPDELTQVIDGRLAKYSADPHHYIPLCVECHYKFDH